MTCSGCGAKNSHKAKRCRKCKGNPRKAGHGIGSHHEVSPMGHATQTKAKRRHMERLACRNNKGKLSGYERV